MIEFQCTEGRITQNVSLEFYINLVGFQNLPDFHRRKA